MQGTKQSLYLGQVKRLRLLSCKPLYQKMLVAQRTPHPQSKLNKQKFTEFWKNFLILIEMVAFVSLNFNSIYTYAYDVRPSIYEIFESQGFKKTHVQSKVYNYEGKIYDAIIHTKKNKWN